MNNQNKQIAIGGFVRYKMKNELGLIGEMTFNGARCWYHMGGTRAMTPYDLIERISIEEVLENTFSNEYAKASLIERHYRLHEGGDTSDLIDDPGIRPEVRQLIKEKESSNE